MPSLLTFDPLNKREGMAERISARLRIRLGHVVEDFQIDFCVGGLILQGRISTYYGKQMAQEVSKSVSGLRVVTNSIDVYSSKEAN